MAMHRSDIVFDIGESGSIYVGEPKDNAYFYKGLGSNDDRNICKLALKLYDLGAVMAREEIRKALNLS